MLCKTALCLGWQYPGTRLSYTYLVRRGEATLSKERAVFGSQVAKPVFHRADQWDKRKHVAMIDEHGTHTYGELSVKSRLVALALENELSFDPNRSKNVSFLCGNNSSFVDALWGIWRQGSVAVPLCRTQPPHSLEYYIKDSSSDAVITTKEFVDKIYPCLKGTNTKLLLLEEILSPVIGKNRKNVSIDIFDDNLYDENSNAMMIYTSGTTGVPKGCVLTHKNLIYQINSMLDAWGWCEQDCILHVLPLHHTHGMINCLLCPLAVNAKILMLPKFDAKTVWEIFLDDKSHNKDVSVFMAVPTIYAKLIQEYHNMGDEIDHREVKEMITSKIRLMVSGSAHMPDSVLESWKRITGYTLLERYGMTELGMVLSDPFEQTARKPGFVGHPMPGVQVRIVKPTNDKEVLVIGDYDGIRVLDAPEKQIIGELQVNGPAVFKEYYNKPEATKKEFTKDRWFKTRDTAEFVLSDGKDGYEGAFRILGRSNVDVITTGGLKVGALNVERILVEHPQIREVAVVGVDDLTWGQKVGAVISLEDSTETLTIKDLRKWSENRLPKHEIPSMIKIMETIPRSVSGTVNKQVLAKAAFPVTNSIFL